MRSILVVDDELSIRESFSLILEGKYQIYLAASGEAALKVVADQKVDMVYLDVRMPGMNGIETLQRLRQIDPDVEVIMVTAVNDVHNASKAINLGARNYVVKPFDVDHILKLTEQILGKKAILSEAGSLRDSSLQLIGQSEKMDRVRKAIDNLKDERVLLVGETGVEKELIARVIHEQSGRASAPFKSFSLSHTMSENLINTLLCGRGKGSSTAELEGKSGLLEEAKRGSLFVDNLEAIPEGSLKVLAGKEFTRVGSQSPIRVDSRFIGGAASSLAEKNKPAFTFFGEKVIEVPALRERVADIPILVDSYLEIFNQKYGREVKLSPSVKEALGNYSWPGNTAQLESLILRFVLADANQIELDNLPVEIVLATIEAGGHSFISVFEKEYIHNTLEKYGRDKGKAAASLGINPTLLEVKI